MKNIKENFEVIWKTKHKNNLKLVFKIPIGKQKKWWELWKKNDNKKMTIEVVDKLK